MAVDNLNIGLCCDAFPPVMDGVSVCVENYAYWLQKRWEELELSLRMSLRRTTPNATMKFWATLPSPFPSAIPM